MNPITRETQRRVLADDARGRGDSYQASLQTVLDRLNQSWPATAAQLADPTDPDGRNVAGKLTALRYDGLVERDRQTGEYLPTDRSS